jgi:hypothetical protein
MQQLVIGGFDHVELFTPFIFYFGEKSVISACSSGQEITTDYRLPITDHPARTPRELFIFKSG